MILPYTVNTQKIHTHTCRASTVPEIFGTTLPHCSQHKGYVYIIVLLIDIFNMYLYRAGWTDMLPYQLTPNLITFTGFQKGSTKFSAVVRLGTGEQGEPSIKRSVIIDNARKMSSSSSTMYCVLLYSNAFYLPLTPLCSYDMMVSETCEMLLEEHFL